MISYVWLLQMQSYGLVWQKTFRQTNIFILSCKYYPLLLKNAL